MWGAWKVLVSCGGGRCVLMPAQGWEEEVAVVPGDERIVVFLPANVAVAEGSGISLVVDEVATTSSFTPLSLCMELASTRAFRREDTTLRFPQAPLLSDTRGLDDEDRPLELDAVDVACC